MNREIKFRGFCKEKNTWVYGMLSKIPKFGETFRYVMVDVFRNESNGEFQGLVFLNDEVEIESIGQFVGRKDKNGVEIFDKDIIRYTTSWTDSFGKTKVSNHIKLLEYDSELCKYDFSFVDMQGIEIIGNIYENPELLT